MANDVPIDLDAGLPVSGEDRAALRRMRDQTPSWLDYDWHVVAGFFPADALQRRATASDTWQPFSLSGADEPLSPADLRAFVNRDWDAVDRSKRSGWADQVRQHGPAVAWHASAALLEYAQSLAPYPSDADRADDLAHHLRLRTQLDQAARAFNGR